MRRKDFKSAEPSKRALAVTCSPYYRRRADTQRALKGHPSKTGEATGDQTKGNDAAMATLADWRELEGLSVEELAEKADVAVSQIEAIEAGSLDAPLSAYLKLAKALRISAEKIIGHTK